MSEAASRRRADAAKILLSPRLRVSASPRLRVSTWRLTQLLIAKSIADALFVAVLAVTFHYAAFNPYFRGSIDAANAQSVAGWVVDEGKPAKRVEVQLYIDDHFAASGLANLWRPDVVAAGRASDEWHGFSFSTPPLQSGEHEARVYAVHESGGGIRRTLQMIAKPARFKVETNAAKNTPSNSVQEEGKH